jgi:hypothetical protein
MGTCLEPTISNNFPKVVVFSRPQQPAPYHFGEWFSPLAEGDVKKTDLSIFLHFGEALGDLRQVGQGKEWVEFFSLTLNPLGWIKSFLHETDGIPLPESRAAANRLLAILNEAHRQPIDPKRAITSDEAITLFFATNEFFEAFDREHRNIDVFTVTPKGLYDTRLLVEKTEEKFPENVRKHFSSTMLYDLRQAGRCLAFEVTTACAFHIFRFTEALTLLYYEKLAKQPWPLHKRDLGIYITELEKLPKVNTDVTTRLNEIRKFERNPTIHPEHIVALERAPILFELCTGAIFVMGEEIEKL